jgi:hypothetical protein
MTQCNMPTERVYISQVMIVSEYLSQNTVSTVLDLMENTGIIDRIEGRGYNQKVDRNGDPILFSYMKPITSMVDEKEDIIQVDFLTSRDLTAGTLFKPVSERGCDGSLKSI